MTPVKKLRTFQEAKQGTTDYFRNIRETVTFHAGLPKWQRRLMSFFAINTIYSFLLLLANSQYQSEWIQLQEIFILCVFVVEYGVKIYLSPNRWRYIFSFFGIIDLLSTLPIIAPVFRQLQLTQMFQGLQVLTGLRVLKFIRIIFTIKIKHQKPDENSRIIIHAIRQERELLVKTASVIVSLAITGAILVYAVESPVQPDKFTNLFDAFWWAFITFTTVGYGDIYPITIFGRLIAMGLSVLGIAMFAIPTTVISSSLINRYANKNQGSVEQTLTAKLDEIDTLKAQGRLNEIEYQAQRTKILSADHGFTN